MGFRRKVLQRGAFVRIGDDVQPGAFVHGGAAQSRQLRAGDGLIGEGHPVGSAPRYGGEQLPLHRCRGFAAAVADAGEQIRSLRFGPEGDHRADAVAVQCEAKVEQRGSAGEPLLAPVRIGDREAPLGICPDLDHVGVDAKPPWLAVVQ
jgi:hypothetical protein